MAKREIDLEKNKRDPARAAARLDMWAREKVKAARIRKKPVYDYIPELHNPEPLYRPGSQDAFKHPSLIGNKRVKYWGYVDGKRHDK